MNTTTAALGGIRSRSPVSPGRAPAWVSTSRAVAQWLGLSLSPAGHDLYLRSELLRLADSYEATQSSYAEDLRAAATSPPRQT